MTTESFIPTRPSLLGRLKDWEDQDSWQEFVAIYGGLVRGTALKAGMTETEADDVVQETFLAVARNIGSFRYDPAKCSFKSWLLLITRQRIIWQWRKRPPVSLPPPSATEDGTRTAAIERIPDETTLGLDAHWDAEWEKHLLAAALERVKRKVNPEQLQVFDLYCVEQWPAQKVARTLGINLGQVYLAKHRVGRLLKKEIELLRRGPG